MERRVKSLFLHSSPGQRRLPFIHSLNKYLFIILILILFFFFLPHCAACKEIQPVYSEGDQPWDFFGRNDAKAETPVLWPPHAKS